MKNKYQRMNKEEKKDIQNKYYNTANGKIMQNRFNRLLIISIMSIIFSLYLTYSSYFKDNNNIFEYITAIILLLAAIVFLVGRHKIKIKELNKFAIKTNK